MMKKIILSLLLAVSSMGFAAENNYLFFQNASKGSITKQDNNSYTLTLNNATDFVSYFTNRPARISGVMKLSEFLALWSDKKIKDNFAETPPNVALVIVTDKGERLNAIAELKNPVSRKGSLSYQLKVINNQILPAGKLQHIALFIDDIPWNPGAFGR
jgi:hypothetical protein